VYAHGVPAETNLSLTTPLADLPGVGPRRAEFLAELGVRNLGQLIAYLPTRHEREEAESAISERRAGAVGCARGEISATRVVKRGVTRARFEAVMIDETGRLDLVWFNALYMADRIHPGLRVRVQGKADRRGPGLRMTNPRLEVLDPRREEAASKDSRVRPVYSASERISSRQIEGIISRVLAPALTLIQDHLSPEYRAQRELPELFAAYRAMHAPASESEALAARRRLAYDELLLLQLGVQIKRAQRRERARATALKWTQTIDNKIRKRFPFALTEDQDGVVRDIISDLTRATPTNRLIQGDVGSGKTVVALYAMLMAVASKTQAAIMAPTEILADQHFASITKMLAGSEVRVELLTGAVKPAARALLLERLARGEIDLLVGTHALLTKGVRFSNLSVVIIDEQHRFGVHQRAALRSKGDDAAGADGRVLVPHVLVMTATPIPRTLALTLFGDLDVSTIRRLPPGRKAIATRVVQPAMRAEVYRFVRSRIDRGEQAYVVVPAIEGADDGLWVPGVGAAPRLRSVEETLKDLTESLLPGVRVGVMHGRLRQDERDKVMKQFREQQLDVLLSTTVIEVGVDVPNATVMVIEDAERFGLAQLHQLRGRVGRGSKSSACVLVAGAGAGGEEAQARLEALAKISDGFKLAERDLELRGFGEIMGLKQSGMPPFRVADLSKDLNLLTLASRDAAEMIGQDATLSGPSAKLLHKRLMKAHGQWLGLADVG
jgi:ATP-dependent DNA helicase RecG